MLSVPEVTFNIHALGPEVPSDLPQMYPVLVPLLARSRA